MAETQHEPAYAPTHQHGNTDLRQDYTISYAIVFIYGLRWPNVLYDVGDSLCTVYLALYRCGVCHYSKEYIVICVSLSYSLMLRYVAALSSSPQHFFIVIPFYYTPVWRNSFLYCSVVRLSKKSLVVLSL